MKCKKGIILFVILTMISSCMGCSSTPKYQVNSQLDTSKQITLKIAGSSADFKAMETMTQKFKEIYPNCKVEYEYLQDYQETLFKRLDAQNNSVDMFVTDNIQKTSANYPYALELFSHSDKLDLSNTSQELLDNYKLTDSDTDEIYAVAMGIEVRGLYVNKTLLDSLGLKIPENREEFLDSCRVLSEHGYIPLQSNPGSFGQQLIFPYVAHIVAAANDEGVTYNTINNCEEGAAEIFRDPLEFLYGLVDKNYYNYKYAETELGMYVDASPEGNARSFLNIVDKGNGFEKQDDVGIVVSYES